MQCPVDEKVHFRHLLLFAFSQGSTVAEDDCGSCRQCRFCETCTSGSCGTEWRKLRKGTAETAEDAEPEAEHSCGSCRRTRRSALQPNDSFEPGNSGEIQEKRPDVANNVILQHYNARPTRKTTRNAVEELRWEILSRPPNSPDLAPSDYHPFRSHSNGLSGLAFDNDDALKTWLDDFFASKPADFYRRGIDNLVQRWQEVVETEGEYIVD